MSIAWSNPALLTALGVVVVPVLVHLLARLWHRRVDFAAVMFLPTGTSRRERLGRLRQAALLLLRSAALALLVLALAGPRGLRGEATADGGLSLLIVLDCSPSMGVRVAGRSRLDDARQLAAAALARLGPGDRAGLLLAGATRDPLPPAADLSPVLEALSSAHVGASGCDLLDQLERGADLLASQPPRRRLLVITDAQQRNFDRLDAVTSQRLARRLRELGIDATLQRVGADDADNLLVRDVRVLNPPLIRDVPAEIEVELQHHGSGTPPPVPLRITVSGRTLLETMVAVEPGGRQRVRRTIRLSQAGPQVLTARIDVGDLDWDNRFDLALDVSEPLGVLVLGDAPVGNGAPRTSAEFVRAALAPFRTAGAKGADLARVDLVPSQRYPEAWRPSHRVIVVIGGGQLRESQVRALEQFVYGGGGLLFIPEPATSASTLADRLWRQGRSVLPARPGAWRRFETPTGAVVAPLEWWRDAGAAIPAARFREAIEFDATDDHVVCITLENGLPLLLERRFGRGTVAAWATPLDADSSSLPLTDAFLPLMQSLLRHLAATPGPDRQLPSGAAIVARFPGTRETTGLVVRPDGSEQRLPLLSLGDDAELRYEQTDLPGPYRVQVRGVAEPFVVLRDGDESRLRGIADDDDRVRALFGGLHDVLESPPIATGSAGGIDLAPLLLLGALVLLMLELLAAGAGHAAWERR